MKKRTKKTKPLNKPVSYSQYSRLPKTLKGLSPAYKALIRELAKR